MRRFDNHFLLLLPALVSGMLSGLAGEKGDSEYSIDETIKGHVYAAVSRDEEKGFVRKAPPKPDEWLFTQHERPQSFEQYRVTAYVRPADSRRTIVLQPLGEMNAEQRQMLEDLRAYAEAFFQLPARIESSLDLTAPAGSAVFSRPVAHPLRREGYDRQYNADAILDSILLKRIPPDAVVYLGITMQDLYSADLHYVFGLGSVQQRVGVYSLCRYFPEFWNQKRLPGAATTALCRACKVLNHETGHMFGLLHCVFYNCSMNGSMSLNETDAAPIHFCPVCSKKLLWNTGADSEKRCEALRLFYAKHRMSGEAAFMEQSLVGLRKSIELERARSLKDE